MNINTKKDIVVLAIAFQLSLILCILKLTGYTQISWFIVVYPFVGFVIISFVDFLFLIGITAFIKCTLKFIIKLSRRSKNGNVD